QRHTAIYLASELAAAGLNGGDEVVGVSLMTSGNANQMSGDYENFRVGIMHTSDATTSTSQAIFPANSAYQEVFGPHTFAPSDLNTPSTYVDMPFSSPFVWNGVDNIRFNFQHFNNPAA